MTKTFQILTEILSYSQLSSIVSDVVPFSVIRVAGVKRLRCTTVGMATTETQKNPPAFALASFYIYMGLHRLS